MPILLTIIKNKMSEDQNAKQNIIIATMQKDIEYIKKSIDALIKSVDNHINQCENRYASKWVEKAVGFVIGGVAIIIIGATLSLIIK